ncbi:MAG: hypothetical protein KF857_12905 [Fimbriimonadaceae bacterium]|nr:hypothetical protein [Fimbriimonadaceae bacterium]
MSVLGLIAYLFASFCVGGLLTLVVSMFRSVKKQDEWRAWVWVVSFGLLTAAAPYIYLEAMTRTAGKDMYRAAEKVVKDAEIQGDLAYYRVISANDKEAKAYVVASEDNGIGMKEHVVIKVSMEKVRDGWKPTEYEILNSFRRQRDAVAFPPLW